MAYGVTIDGFVIKPLEVIRDEIDAYQRSNIDPGLDLDDQSALGQMNASHVIQLAEIWELAQAVYNAMYPDSASGDSLDNVCSITGTARSAQSKTYISGVQVTLNPNAGLPAGSVAHLSSQPNARFLSVTAVPADPVGGVFTVDFEAEIAGATVVTPGQLNTIAEPVTGWTAVTNPNAGVTGTDTEDDSDLRIKRIDELEAQGSTNVNSIRADLLRLASVVDARVFENDTDVVDPVLGIPPHAIYCILRGGSSTAVAEQIFESKAAGIATHGTVTETVTDSDGFDHDIKFSYATELTYYADVTVQTDPLVFDATGGADAIKASIAAYVNALRIGGDVIYDLVKCAIFDIPGIIKITALLHGFSDPPSSTVDLTVGTTQYAKADIANIDVTVT